MTDLIKQQRPLGQVLAESFRLNIRQYFMMIALVAIWIGFTIITAIMGKPLFLSPDNMTNLIFQTSYIAILAVGMVLVIVAGHIDLSVGSLAGMCGAMVAILQARMGVPDSIAILITLVVGIAMGMWQGYWIAYRRVPAFIVTLAGMLVFKGIMLILLKGQTIYMNGNDFKQIAQGFVPQLFLKGDVVRPWEYAPANAVNPVPFHDLTIVIAIVVVLLIIIMDFRSRKKRAHHGFETLPIQLQILKLALLSLAVLFLFFFMVFSKGLPLVVFLIGAVVVVYNFIATKTVFGRQVYAIGGNKEAAKLSGINIQSRTFMVFVSMGFLSALAGIVYTARLNSGTPSAGNLFELDAIAGAIIGGTSTMGGEGTITGAIIGALIMSSLTNGMLLINVDSNVQFIVRGLVLLLAVWFDVANQKKS